MNALPNELFLAQNVFIHFSMPLLANLSSSSRGKKNKKTFIFSEKLLPQ